MTLNQNPEQLAMDTIDAMFLASGWVIQSKNSINLKAKKGVAVREYTTHIGPTDYVLFVDAKPVGVIEAKRAEEGVRLAVHEDQSMKLKHGLALPIKWKKVLTRACNRQRH
jgi:type I restriction enzyme, R subunit